MRTHILFILFVLNAFMMAAQNNSSDDQNTDKERAHKIVFQLTNSDPEVHKGLMRQIGHVLEAAPNTKIEIVYHGPGLDILVAEKTTVLSKIKEYKSQNVVFVACENTLKQKNLNKSQIIAESDFVQAGIIEIVIKQEQGWSYIKAGN